MSETATAIAETQAIAGILAHPKYAHRLLHDLEPTHFTNPVNIALFQAATKVWALDEEVHPSGILEQLTDEQLERMGGPSTILKFGGEFVPTNLDGTVRTLVRARAERQVANVLDQAKHDAERGAEPGKLVRRVQHDLDEAVRCLHDNSVIRVSELCDQATETVAKAKDGTLHAGSVRTGIAGFDSIVGQGLQPGSLVIFGARPSMGKTSIMVNVAMSAAQRGKTVCFASLEDTPINLILKMASVESGVSWFNVQTQKAAKAQTDRFQAGIDRIRDLPVMFTGGSPTDINAVISSVSRANHWMPLDLVMIDFLQLLKDPSASAQNRHNEISDIVVALKELAKSLNVPVVVASQLNRGVETRDGCRPRLSDLRDSGSIEAAGDVIGLLHRESYFRRDLPDDGYMELDIAKNRHGATGLIELEFQRDCGLIRDWRGESRKQHRRGA